MKILIADDDAVWARVLSRHMAAAGHEALCAGTWEEARRLAEQSLPDAILLDHSLPDGEAEDFCARLRADSRFDLTALLLYSGTGGGCCAGADRCLLKGEPMGPLPSEIAAAVAARRGYAAGD